MKGLVFALVSVSVLVAPVYAGEKSYEERMDEYVVDGKIDIEEAFDKDTTDYLKQLIERHQESK